jgi:hypothetical protein
MAFTQLHKWAVRDAVAAADTQIFCVGTRRKRCVCVCVSACCDTSAAVEGKL